MKIAVLGTGMVGQAHAGKLSELGHEVVMGTHDTAKTMAKTQPDAMGRPPLSRWLKDNKAVKLASFSEAARHGEIIVEALSGEGALEILSSIKKDIAGKILIDISNPLDFSKGRPPTLFVCNDDSLGEQLQKALPEAKVVKAFNTTNAFLQVDPGHLAGGDHHLFVAGNDEAAKKEVIKFAKAQYGWENILDLGDIKSARGMEMILPIWLEVMGALKTPHFNFKIAQ